MPAPINRMDAGDPIAEPRETPGASGIQWIFTKKFWRSWAAIQEFVQAGGGGGIPGSAIYDFGILAAGSQSITTTAPTANGQILFVQITQNAAGDGRITWAAMFHPATPTGFNFDANATSIFSFVSIGLLWTPFTNSYSLV